VKRLTEAPRPLNATETRLVQYGMSEREAVALAPHITLTENARDAEIEHAVICAIVCTAERIHGPAKITYLCGERRDILRAQK
jgi:hypothetical protein